MVSSIGSMANSILQFTSAAFSAGSTEQAAQSFDELVGSGQVSTQESSSSSGVASAGGGGSSSGTNSEMDLNNDGQVTIDEIIKYTQMQMQEQMSEQMSSDEGAAQMAQDTQKQSGIEEFKSKQAASAYSAIQNSVIDMLTEVLI